MSEKSSAVKDERAELAKLEAQVARKRFQVESKENFGGFDHSVPAETEDTYASYMSKRPEAGVVRDDFGYRNAQTGDFDFAKNYHNGIESQADYDNRSLDRSIAKHEADEKSYEDMSLTELAVKLGEAEAADDRSTENEMLALIEERIDDYAEKYEWDKKTKADGHDRRDAHLTQLVEVARNTRDKIRAAAATTEAESRDSRESREPLSEGEAMVADILKFLNDNPEAANEDMLGRLREIQVYLPDDEATRDQALAEYETHEGAPYDANKAYRLENNESTRDAALAAYRAEEGHDLDVDQGRSENNDATRDEALAEHKAKGNSLDEINDAGAQYEADQRDLMLQTRDDELREGLEQREADRNNGDHWWSSPMARLAGVLTVRSWSLRERIENSSPRNRRLAIGVLGAVGIAGIAILVKNNIHTGGSGGGGHHDAARGAADASQHGAGNLNQHVELPPQHGPTVEFSDAAHHVSSGKGWLEQLDDMKVPRLEQPGLLAKILNSDDPGIKDWVYKMGDGNPGMSHTGSMPQSVLESINALR